MLLAAGLAEVDAAGLPAYLEGSAAGRGLYERHGFREIEEHVVDYALYGGKGTERIALMKREARPGQNP